MNQNLNNIPTIESEVDIPLQKHLTNSPPVEQLKKLSKKHATDLEETYMYAEKMEKHVYKRHGLNLLIGCGIAYIILVLFDTFIINNGGQTSLHMEGLIELIKFIMSTLIGFVFSDKLKDKQ